MKSNERYGHTKMKQYNIKEEILENILRDLQKDHYLSDKARLSKRTAQETDPIVYVDDYVFQDAAGAYRTDEVFKDILLFLRRNQLKFEGQVPNRLEYQYIWDLIRYNFIVPWKSFTNTMEKLVYVLSCIKKPFQSIAVGINCGYTFGFLIAPLFWQNNIGQQTFGIEKNQRLADIARRNISHLFKDDRVSVICQDALAALDNFQPNSFDLTFLDTKTDFRILEKLYEKIKPGGWLLMHNASDIHFKDTIQPYLNFVRDPRYFCASYLFPIDAKGLELSVKKGDTKSL